MTTKFGIKKLETSLYRVYKMRFDNSNRLGVDYECDGRTDRQTDGRTGRSPAVIARSNDQR